MVIVNQVKQLISEVNRLHLDFSNDYFETGEIDKVNLSKTIQHVPVAHIYKYRLTLHESINDYLMKADIDIKFFYRVKTRESMDDKLDDWQDKLALKSWYLREKEGYRGLHIYFKNKNDFYFPWELQIWDIEDMQSNIQSYEKFKRSFV